MGQIESSLRDYVRNTHVRGLILTGFDSDHAHAEGVDSILTHQEPDWVMYPKYYKDTDCASAVFAAIDRHVRRRERGSHPLVRHSVRLDRLDSRHLTGLANSFRFELFSPHIEDMGSSNNSSIVLKLSGLDATGFGYLITGDTETERWATIDRFFGKALRAEVMSAPHHGSTTGVHAGALLDVSPNTVLISAGVDSQYEHPDPAAVAAYQRVARHVFSTNANNEPTCLFTRRLGDDFETRLVSHPASDE